VTSATDNSSLSTILARTNKNNAVELLEFSPYVPRRTKSTGSGAEEQSAEDSADVAYNNSSSIINIEPSAVSQPDFELMTKAVNAACAMLKELGQRNEEITSTAESAVASLKTQLAVERDRSSKLQKELDAVKSEKERLANENQSRIKQLETLNATLTDNLEQMIRELDSTKPWLEYLGSQIHIELQGAVSDAERILSNPFSLPN
jgi:DNA repair exonuclease SbcCD ATPase subunit